MEVLYARCCGIDVHQRVVVACLSLVEAGLEHLWRILQGGELIAPIPPLPPRESSPSSPSSMPVDPPEPQERSGPRTSDAPTPALEVAEPPVKKTRSRKKSETNTLITPAEQGSTQEASPDVSPVPAPPKRGRRKKSTEAEVTSGEARTIAPAMVENKAKAKQDETEEAPSKPKPKRGRSVGEPAPKRYAVGDVAKDHSP